ncbi:GrpE-domain-containing protein [Schizophyllum commune H4-8]|uniref:GrpE protein homolog, mitochondrial n=1 Tax=Schizophyllum commune (strain H4-8 / FGSC 9210) TaxID=578458 RepID=D8PVD7_SCHCM|nr:GrpE-domain-containing protein [Schizophyllum commune H4-8]KAI5900396.1 GrpE-domain-containing protein [Schizophyllum commune H4-8]
MNASLFRSCTASLSARALTRPAARAGANMPCRAALARRYYSEKAPESPAADAAKEEPAKDEGKAAEGASPAEKECLEKLKTKEAEVVDLTSRLRYLQADFLNLQRNASREKEQTRDFAITKFAKDLLETVDVLSLALKSIPSHHARPQADAPPPPQSADGKPEKGPAEYLHELYNGVEMTQRQLQSTLSKYNVKPIEPLGDKFDPNMHEALYQAPIPGKEPGTVIDVQKTGYMIKDRVLRAAQVGVAQETS